jgi:hypothetical protein
VQTDLHQGTLVIRIGCTKGTSIVEKVAVSLLLLQLLPIPTEQTS